MVIIQTGLVLMFLVFGAQSLDLHYKDPVWKSFKMKFNKTYSTIEEELLRYSIFQQNVKLINSHNVLADKGLRSFWTDINHFADMTHAEYLETMTGLLHDSDVDQGGEKFENEAKHRSSNLSDIPREIDWRRSGCITRVKYQGQCGSCYAFASTGALEFQHCRKSGKLVSLSEQNIIDCTTNDKYHDKGCHGGKMDHAYQYIISNDGIDTERGYPYRAKLDSRCMYSTQSKGATMVAFKDIRPGDEDELTRAVGTQGPVSVGIDARGIMFKYYSSGVYDSIFCSSVKVNHGVLVVGYGREYGSDFWIIKNSWSQLWGLQGYMKMVRNKGNRCGIATMASYPLV